MADYGYDTLLKTMKRSTHLSKLDPILERLEKFKLKVNPKKCAFGVTSRKLLGYIVSAKGIEVDPKKLKLSWKCHIQIMLVK